jgi:glycine cleavage system pyridoxal-binding protein P
MLETLGCKSLDELMNQTVPSSIRLKKEDAFEHGRNSVVGIDSQHVVLEHMKNIAD